MIAVLAAHVPATASLAARPAAAPRGVERALVLIGAALVDWGHRRARARLTRATRAPHREALLTEHAERLRDNAAQIHPMMRG